MNNKKQFFHESDILTSEFQNKNLTNSGQESGTNKQFSVNFSYMRDDKQKREVVKLSKRGGWGGSNTLAACESKPKSKLINASRLTNQTCGQPITKSQLGLSK